MARLLVVSRSMALALRLADAHEVIEHPVEQLDRLAPDPACDVLVLDLGEPAAAIHALDRLRGAGYRTPVLIVSGYQPTWAGLVCVELPDVVVVPLPITRAALLGGIDELLRGAAERAGRPIPAATVPPEPPVGTAPPAGAPAAAPAPADPQVPPSPAPTPPRPATPAPAAQEPPAAAQTPAWRTMLSPWTGPVPRSDSVDLTLLDLTVTDPPRPAPDPPARAEPGEPTAPAAPNPPPPGGWAAQDFDWWTLAPPGPEAAEPDDDGADPPAVIPPEVFTAPELDVDPAADAAPEVVADAAQGAEDVAAAIARRRALLGRGEIQDSSGQFRQRLAGRSFASSLGPGGSSAELVALGAHPDQGRPQPQGLVTLEPAPSVDPGPTSPFGAPGAAPTVTPAPTPAERHPDPGQPSRWRRGGGRAGRADTRDDLLDGGTGERPQTWVAATPPGGVDAELDDVPAGPGPVGTLVEQLTRRAGELFGVADTAQVLADELVERGNADAAAVLVPDGPVWRVSGGVGLRPLERRLVLDSTHWLIAEIAVTGRALLVEDTDIVRTKLAGAPLAAWRHLLAVPVPQVQAAVVLARGQEAGAFTEAELTAIVGPVREAAGLLGAALQIRHLARLLAPLRDADAVR